MDCKTVELKLAELVAVDAFDVLLFTPEKPESKYQYGSITVIYSK